MVKSTFRLSAYLKDLSCELKLVSGTIIKFNEVSYTEETDCESQFNTMVHSIWASAVTDMKVIKDSVGILTINYWLNFTGHPSEKPESIKYIVPLIKRTTVNDL